MRAWAAVLLALPLAVLAQASASPPPLPQAVLAGSGRLTFWGFAVYDAQLWVTPGFRRSTFADHPVALQLNYLRAFKAADVARRSLQEMQRAGPIDAATAQRWEDGLRSVLPDMQPGDRILGVHRPRAGAEFFLNGRRIGLLADPEFARRFFAIWLGPATSEPALRDALLAGTEP
jgi:hypothetical protein